MKQTWSVVMIHREGAAKAHAVQFCDRLAQRFWDQFDFDIHWWTFDDLRASEKAAAAAQKAATANSIVFATQDEESLPDHLRCWIENWVMRRKDREGMLVGLLPTTDETGATMTQTQTLLRDAAHRSGMDYLSGLPENLSLPMPESLDTYFERADQVTSVLDEILHHQVQPAAPRACRERAPSDRP